LRQAEVLLAARTAAAQQMLVRHARKDERRLKLDMRDRQIHDNLSREGEFMKIDLIASTARSGRLPQTQTADQSIAELRAAVKPQQPNVEISRKCRFKS
jgi:hypothetical protein